MTCVLNGERSYMVFETVGGDAMVCDAVGIEPNQKATDVNVCSLEK